MIDAGRIVAMNQHYKNYSIDFFLDTQERLGIKNIELWMSMQHFPLDCISYGDCKTFLSKLSSRHLNLVAATLPSCDFQYQYACQSKEYRSKTIEYFKNGIDAAAELGAGIVTCNSGWGYFNETFNEGIKATKEIISQVAYHAEKRKVTLVMETLTSEETNLINNRFKLKTFIEEINSSALKVMIDTVAMYQNGENMEQWFELFGSDIKYMHFIDGGMSWEHLAWGDGIYPLEEMLDTISKYGYKGYISQELITESYLKNPQEVDKRNLCVLNKLLS